MNQFKIGDTVWTVKRGKCEVTGNNPSGLRPYSVFSMKSGYHYPKLSNIYRTEAEMIEAKRNKGVFNTEYTFSFTIDTPQPKFKRGDKVYWNGKKWEVTSSDDQGRVCLKREGYRMVTLESNLRLWKEHEFVLKVGSESTGVYKTECTVPTNTKYSVKYIGKHMHTGMDTLILTYSDGTIDIFLGKKGDIEI